MAISTRCDTLKTMKHWKNEAVTLICAATFKITFMFEISNVHQFKLRS